jgi:hypothetical protein
MTDEAWEKYDRDLAEYNREVYAIDRASGRYRRVSRRRPPSPPAHRRGRGPRSLEQPTMAADEGAPALGAAAREALAQLFGADATNGEGPFVIVRPNGAHPLVAKRQFRAEVEGRALLELERAGLLLPNSRDAHGLKSFYLASDSRQRLDSAKPGLLGPTPRIQGQLQRGRWPQEARGTTRESIWATYDELAQAEGRRPTREKVARALHTTESTLERAQRDLGIPGWPPPRRPIDRI